MAQPAKTAKQHRFILFGGQGSSSIFSSNAAATAEQDARSVSSGTILLSRCHAAFLEEITSLDAESRELLGIDVASFISPTNLLSPAPKYHTHPVLQATTIFLCQLLHYLAETNRQLKDGRDQGYESIFDSVHETAGFSSGILPATVVACSRTLDELVACGVEAFQLAFWIACRTHLLVINQIDGEGEKKEDSNQKATLSLVIRGLSRDQIEERISHYYSNPTSGCFQDSDACRIQMSAISSSNMISLSGPKEDLYRFETWTQSASDQPLSTTFAFVHGWYHGGQQLECLVEQVLHDCQRRQVSLPYSSHAKPIRSTLDGTIFHPSSSCDPEVTVEWLARHFMVHCVDWKSTAREMAVTVQGLVGQDPDGGEIKVKIISFGPSSGSLFPPDLVSQPDSRIECLDLSSFKPTSSKPPPLALDEDHKDSVAIVGMSVNLPKGKGTDQLWETLSQGLNAVQEVPETRFRISDYYTEDDTFKSARSMPTKYGAFMEDPFSFHNAFFNISPREAKSMDPQQRILLHTAQEALEDAGYVPDSSPASQKSSTGCYIGLATGDYTANLTDDIDVFYSSGTLRAFHSGRISYFYKLSGPSIVTDTACSSSMVSIYQACRALQTGDCTSAIAGGVNVITSPDMYLGLARGHFLSKTGNCKPFDASADGYCRAEGCVIFVLKRLSDAVAEGDRIHGVIRNVVINQSGNSHSITHPHSQTQIDLFRSLLDKTKVDPASVGVIEAHGTGTQAGDAREVESLSAVFGAPHHSAAKPLVLSSIKGNIGHCEAASGAAGLAKLLLMLRERKIPMQAGFNTVNPSLADSVANSGFVVPRDTMPWIHSLSTPRRALLNNFGAAGSNGSLLLEEWVEPKSNIDKERSAYPFTLSAKSNEALRWAVDSHVQFLNSAKSDKRRPSLQDICYTSTARRQAYDHRVSISCSSVDDLVAKLQQHRDMQSEPAAKASAIVFAFAGQGSWYNGAGKELLDTFPEFKDTIMECDKTIRALDRGYPSIMPLLDGRDQGLDLSSDTDQIIASQCACVALEIALAKMFISWGITPKYVMGHSLGEYAALCISGVLTMEDTFRLVAGRARMMSEKCVPGETGMLACGLSSERAEQLISASPTLAQLSVACRNSPKDCVIAGPLGQLELFREECKGVRTKILDVPYAFHSPAMDPIVEPLEELGRSVKFGRRTIPIVSNVYGRFLEEKDLTSSYFSLHARQPVLFLEGLLYLQSKLGHDSTVFLDIGPHPTTLPMLRASMAGTSGNVHLGTLHKGQAAWKSISETLAAISLRRLPSPVNWRHIFTGTSTRVTSLPGHLLQGSTFLVPYKERRKTEPVKFAEPKPDLRIRTGFYLLPWQDPSPNEKQELVFETDLTILGPLISGHDVGGTCICPASVFHELAIEAGYVMLAPPSAQVLTVQGMRFANPLVYVPSVSQEETTATTTIVLVRIKKGTAGGAEFKITSRCALDSKDKETEHCTGGVSLQTLSMTGINTCTQWIKDEALVARQRRNFPSVGDAITSGKFDNISTFRSKVLYEAVFTRVVKYAPEYQSLLHLDVTDSNLEGLGMFQIPSNPGFGSEAAADGYLAHPVFTDTLLHAAGFIANLNLALDSDSEPMIGICARVESIEIAYGDIDTSKETFAIYCGLLEIRDRATILADTIVLNRAGRVVAVVRGIEFKRLRLSAFQGALARHKTAKPSPRTLPKIVASDLDTLLYTPPGSGEVMNSPVTDTNNSVKQLVRDTVIEVGGFQGQHGINALIYTKTLDELGIDSMMRIEIASKLAGMFPGQSLNHHALEGCNTVDEMQGTVLVAVSSSRPMQQVPASPPSICDMPPTNRTSAAPSQHHCALKQTVKDIVVEVGGFETTPGLDHYLQTKSLDELGIDSMMRIEIAAKLSRVFPSTGPSLDHHALEDCSTLDEMQAIVLAVQATLKPSPTIPISDSGYSGSAPTSHLPNRQNPVLLHAFPPRPDPPTPLYLFHDGSGQITPYARLPNHDRTTYATFSPFFRQNPHQRPFQSIPQLAAHYVSLLISTLPTPSTPLILAGWSFGGVVAFHAAQILLTQGYDVKGLILIDSPSPVDHQPLPREVIHKIAAKSPALREEFEFNAGLLGGYVPDGKFFEKRGGIRTVYLMSRELVDVEGMCGEGVRYDWLGERGVRERAVEVWGGLVGGGGMEVWGIPGDHFGGFEGGNVEETAAQIWRACRFIEGRSTE